MKYDDLKNVNVIIIIILMDNLKSTTKITQKINNEKINNYY